MVRLRCHPPPRSTRHRLGSACPAAVHCAAWPSVQPQESEGGRGRRELSHLPAVVGGVRGGRAG